MKLKLYLLIGLIFMDNVLAKNNEEFTQLLDTESIKYDDNNNELNPYDNHNNEENNKNEKSIMVQNPEEESTTNKKIQEKKKEFFKIEFNKVEPSLSTKVEDGSRKIEGNFSLSGSVETPSDDNQSLNFSWNIKADEKGNFIKSKEGILDSIKLGISINKKIGDNVYFHLNGGNNEPGKETYIKWTDHSFDKSLYGDKSSSPFSMGIGNNKNWDLALNIVNYDCDLKSFKDNFKNINFYTLFKGMNEDIEINLSQQDNNLLQKKDENEFVPIVEGINNKYLNIRFKYHHDKFNGLFFTGIKSDLKIFIGGFFINGIWLNNDNINLSSKIKIIKGFKKSFDKEVKLNNLKNPFFSIGQINNTLKDYHTLEIIGDFFSLEIKKVANKNHNLKFNLGFELKDKNLNFTNLFTDLKSNFLESSKLIIGFSYTFMKIITINVGFKFSLKKITSKLVDNIKNGLKDFSLDLKFNELFKPEPIYLKLKTKEIFKNEDIKLQVQSQLNG